MNDAAAPDVERLIATLRNYEGDYHYPTGLLNKAADALSAALERATAQAQEIEQRATVAYDKGLATGKWTAEADVTSLRAQVVHLAAELDAALAREAALRAENERLRGQQYTCLTQQSSAQSEVGGEDEPPGCRREVRR